MRTKLNELRLAKIIEKAFFPINVIIVAALIAIAYQSSSPFFLNHLLIFFSSITLYAFFRKKLGKKIKSETRRFSTPILIAIAVTFLILLFIPISKEFGVAFLALVVLVLVFHIVRDKWKISAHTATYTAASMALTLLNMYFVVFFLLLLIVVWSRLKLKRHTIWQIIAGLILGLAIPLIFYFIFFG
jgi:membrane-associated phospholipid phosphatase